MSNLQKAIFLMILCTLFTSAGQLLWKIGVLRVNSANFWTVLNFPLILGFGSYGLGALLLILAFQKGELGVLNPIIASSYVWVSLAAFFFFNDVINVWKGSGVILILVSVSLIGWGGSR